MKGHQRCEKVGVDPTLESVASVDRRLRSAVKEATVIILGHARGRPARVGPTCYVRRRIPGHASRAPSLPDCFQPNTATYAWLQGALGHRGLLIASARGHSDPGMRRQRHGVPSAATIPYMRLLTNSSAPTLSSDSQRGNLLGRPPSGRPGWRSIRPRPQAPARSQVL